MAKKQVKRINTRNSDTKNNDRVSNKNSKIVIKKRIKILPILILLSIIVVLAILIKLFVSIKVQNIFVYGNNLLSDQEIIDESGISDYPKYYSFSTRKIEKKLQNNNYIEKVNVKRSFFHVIKIEVTEYDILLYNDQSKNYILSNGEEIRLEDTHTGVPVLLNYVVDEVYSKFIKKINDLDKNVLGLISEIKYDPSTYDDGRFFLTMNDGNYVYINLPNFKSLNMYNKIYPNFDGHKGILYLDSGYGEASEYKILK